MCTTIIHPFTKLRPSHAFYPDRLYDSSQIYCIGGKGKFVMLKNIEKYYIS